MSGAEILAGMAIAGTATKIYGELSAASAQADAAKKNSELKNLQANELLAREAINETTLQKHAELSTLQYASAFAGTGKEGAGIGGQVQILSDTRQAVLNSRRDAEFKAEMLRRGAQSDLTLSSDILTAGYITGAGTLLTSGPQLYHSYQTLTGPPRGSAPNLPEV